MFGEMVGGVGCVGSQEKEWMDPFNDWEGGGDVKKMSPF